MKILTTRNRCFEPQIWHFNKRFISEEIMNKLMPAKKCKRYQAFIFEMNNFNFFCKFKSCTEDIDILSKV